MMDYESGTTATTKDPINMFGGHQEIRLQRKPDNFGWLRFNLDNVTEHTCSNTAKKQLQRQEAGGPWVIERLADSKYNESGTS